MVVTTFLPGIFFSLSCFSMSATSVPFDPAAVQHRYCMYDSSRLILSHRLAPPSLLFLLSRTSPWLLSRMYLYSLGLPEDAPQFDLLFPIEASLPTEPPCVARPLPQCSTSPLRRTSTQIPRPSTACARRTSHRRPRWPRRNIRSNSSTHRLP